MGVQHHEERPLAGILLDMFQEGKVELVLGEIVSNETDTSTVYIGGDTDTAHDDIARLKGLTLTVGSVCVMLKDGPDYLIIGAIDGT